MKLLKEKEVNLQGWSVFSNIERPHAAIIMRDPIDAVIKGVRYQIIPVESDGKNTTHKFIFETWIYKARGAIEHHTFASFCLTNRPRYDTKVSKYINDLRILNRRVEKTENASTSVIKFAKFVIDHITYDEHFDVYHALENFGLIEHEDAVVARMPTSYKEEMVSY